MTSEQYEVEQVSAIQKLVRRSADLAGLSTREQARVPQETSPTGALVPEDGSSLEMQRAIAIALVQEEIRAAEAEEEPQTRRALEAAGCPIDMWVDLAADPDFLDVLDQVSYSLVEVPRQTRALIALTTRATTGDPNAYKTLEGRKRRLRPELDEAVREYSQGEKGRQRLCQRIEMLQADLKELLSSYAVVEIDDTELAMEVQAKIDEVQAPPGKGTFDHRSIFTTRKEPPGE